VCLQAFGRYEASVVVTVEGKADVRVPAGILDLDTQTTSRPIVLDVDARAYADALER